MKFSPLLGHPTAAAAQAAGRFEMTSFTSEKIMKSKSIKSKLAIFWSHVFPNVKDFIVTLLTTVFVLYVMVQLKNKKSDHTAKNQKIDVASRSSSKLIVDLQVVFLCLRYCLWVIVQ